MPPTSEQMVAQPAHTPSRMEYGKVSDTEDSRLMSIARKNGMTGETQPQNVTRSRTPSWSHSFFQHIRILAVACDEQAQLRCGLERLREAAHGRRDVLDGGQARRDAAEHIPLLDLRAVGLTEVGCTVELALRAVEFHAVVDLYDALGSKPRSMSVAPCGPRPADRSRESAARWRLPCRGCAA